MRTVSGPAIAACLFVAVLGAGCASAPSSGLHATPPGLGRLPYSDADVDFMSGMIPHHAQAEIMAGEGPSHAARNDLAFVCERVVLCRRAEIGTMHDRVQESLQ